MLRLYRYQEAGATFLAARTYAFLADEMGLGKTATALEAVRMKELTSAHVVCPASAVPVWRAEWEGSYQDHFDLTVESYDSAVLHKSAPSTPVLILDEAHYLKNPRAKRTRWVYTRMARKAQRVWALSGTPTPNHPGELWPHARCLAGEKMDVHTWTKRYCRVRPRDWSPGYQVTGIRGDTLPELQERIRPWMLRRLARDVLRDLPPVRWATLPVTVPGEIPEELAPTKLSVDGLTLDEAVALIESHAAHLSTERRLIGELKVRPVCQAVSDLLQGTQEKVVLFGWHRSVLDEIERWFDGRVVRVDGDTTQSQRARAVARFQGDPDVTVFCGQLLAAGTAITLTAANRAVMVEQSWVPGDLDQAAKRIHRIGQRKPCLVQLAYLEGSLDAAVARTLAWKRAVELLYD